MISGGYEDGKRIISVDTAEEFGQVLDQADNYRVEIEARKEVMEACGIFDSAEKLGIEPGDEGLPRRPTKEAAGSDAGTSFGVLWYARGREIVACPAKLTDLGGI